METLERIEQFMTCDRCNYTERWIGTAGYVAFPDGWWLVFPDWETPYDDQNPIRHESQWVCSDCLTEADSEGLSWALRLSSDAGAPAIELLGAP